MVTTDKVTVAEFSPHIGKTTTDYKENDMGVKEVCGTCKHNQYSTDGNGIRNKGGFYCGNERSENCGVPTFYDDRCDEWEEKK